MAESFSECECTSDARTNKWRKFSQINIQWDVVTLSTSSQRPKSGGVKLSSHVSENTTRTGPGEKDAAGHGERKTAWSWVETGSATRTNSLCVDPPAHSNTCCNSKYLLCVWVIKPSAGPTWSRDPAEREMSRGRCGNETCWRGWRRFPQVASGVRGLGSTFTPAPPAVSSPSLNTQSAVTEPDILFTAAEVGRPLHSLSAWRTLSRRRLNGRPKQTRHLQFLTLESESKTCRSSWIVGVTKALTETETSSDARVSRLDVKEKDS